MPDAYIQAALKLVRQRQRDLARAERALIAGSKANGKKAIKLH